MNKHPVPKTKALDKQTDRAAFVATCPYDLVDKYQQLLQAFNHKDARLSPLLLTNGTSPVNKRLIHDLSATKQKLKDMMSLTNFIIICVHTERKYLQTLPDQDQTLNEKAAFFLVHQIRLFHDRLLSNLKITSCTLHVLNSKFMQIKPDSVLEKALTYHNKKWNQRIDELYRYNIRELMFKTIIRPYYFKLQKENQEFYPVFLTWKAEAMANQEEYDKQKTNYPDTTGQTPYQPFADQLLDFANQQSNPVYRELRNEDFQKNQTKKQEIKHEQFTQREAEHRASAMQILEREIRQKEAKWRKREAAAQNIPYLTKRLVDHPEYNPDGTCQIIMLLVRETDEQGHRKQSFKYLTPEQTPGKLNECDFFFDNQKLIKAKKEAEKLPEILAAQSARVY